MVKKRRVQIDIMNRNTIISLAMLYALWQSKRQDLLDLIRPFILYAVGTTTRVGEEICVTEVCTYMEENFGYKSFQSAVVNRILTREVSTKGEPKIKRHNKKYILVGSYSDLIERFTEKRTQCKSHSDAVTFALTQYLNHQQACKRNNYTQSESEVLLLSFFERQGSSIMLSIDNLRQLTARRNEIDYFVAKFILQEFDQKSVRMDYLVELVKGYFVTTALYLQAENTDVTKASFSDVTFYLDTRILLGYLGYKSKEENDSVQEMVKSLQQSGATLACFPYNIDEVNSILDAYKLSIVQESRRPSTYTLEYFDHNGHSYIHVEAAQRLFEKRLKDGNIITVSPEQALSRHCVDDNGVGLIDDSELEEIILSINPKYNLTSLADDIKAVNTISRIRSGKKLPYIEKCRAVFVTTNTVLVSAIKQYLRDSDLGFPIAITGEDLCVMAWLKDFEQNNSLPQMRLLENVLAAINPSRDLMEAYFSNLDNLEHQGKLSGDEAALLRVDLFARRILMEQTFGEKENLNTDVIESIRTRLMENSIAKGIEIGKTEASQMYASDLNRKRNLVCKRAEEEIDLEYGAKEENTVRIIKFISLFWGIGFIIASCVAFVSQWDSPIKFALFIVSIITTTQGVLPFFAKDNWLIRLTRKNLQRKKLAALDDRKEKYLSIINSEE